MSTDIKRALSLLQGLFFFARLTPPIMREITFRRNIMSLKYETANILYKVIGPVIWTLMGICIIFMLCDLFVIGVMCGGMSWLCILVWEYLDSKLTIAYKSQKVGS